MPTNSTNRDEEKPPQVCPFRIVVDTREQAPWHFTGIDNGLIVPLRTSRSLETGDYSIDGLEHLVTVERKSVGDFMGSITADRARFEREMERAAKLEYAAVVVEGGWRDFDQRKYAVAQGTVIAWSMDYGVHFVFGESRRHAEILAFRILQRFWKRHEARLKAAEVFGQSQILEEALAGDWH